MAWSKLVDMEMDDEDQIDLIMPYPMKDKPRYPPGLNVCLCDSQLDKLGLDADCEEGDLLDARCFMVVTSVYKGDGKRRVEMVIQKMAVENEMTEDDAPGDD